MGAIVAVTVRSAAEIKYAAANDKNIKTALMLPSEKFEELELFNALKWVAIPCLAAGALPEMLLRLKSTGGTSVTH
jgi:hypothetical protein